MVAVTVDRIELLAIGPDGEKVTWSSHLGAMHQALVVARLFLSNGVEAVAGTTTYTEHEFDRTVFSAASLMAPFVLGRDAFDIRAAYADMRKRYVPLGHIATSLFDIALHDGKAKTSGQPIYRMLGASRDEIRAYASSPLLSSDQAYIDYCRQMYEARLSRNQDTSLLRIRRRHASGPNSRRNIRRKKHWLEFGCRRNVHVRSGASYGTRPGRSRLGIHGSTAPRCGFTRLQGARRGT